MGMATHSALDLESMADEQEAKLATADAVPEVTTEEVKDAVSDAAAETCDGHCCGCSKPEEVK